MLTRRHFLKLSAATGAAVSFNLVGGLDPLAAIPARGGLSDPAFQPKFEVPVANALNPGFVLGSPNNKYTVAMREGVASTGLIDLRSGRRLDTMIWGYGRNGRPATWPGSTIVARSGTPVEVTWQNKLRRGHPLPVDQSLHWAYSLTGYGQYSLERDGPPVVTHLHGGHTRSDFDGNPEQFFGPGYRVRGPRWPGRKFVYDNDQPAGTLWYHDHTLGITRLNVYAGLAGFYILRDDEDTGAAGNPLDLPAFPYEMALAIQDRMFTDTGALFYPAFPGDPFYDDFIIGEGADLPSDVFPGGGPTALAEFFGDHMVVNGSIWPRADVEPRNYRLRLLNGCDSRFLVTRFYEARPDATDLTGAVGPLDFTVIGGDQGLASAPTVVDTLVMETGSRYDILMDFGAVSPGSRVIMANIGGDAPFGGAFGDELDPDDLFPNRQTDRIMAFDVVGRVDRSVPDVSPTRIAAGPRVPAGTSRTRKVALFEGKDEFGRLQPLLGTAEPATDHRGRPIHWPSTQPFLDAGLTGPMEGSIAWHAPTTENPALGSTETWEIWNVTGDAHPVHLHLVHFEIVGRSLIRWDSATNNDDRVLDPDGVTAPPPNGDGTYLVNQPVVQHNGELGLGFRIISPTAGATVPRPPQYVENAPKDLVTALPDQVTRIRATFDRPGRYVWHCHILSHEDHEMMRVLHVGPGA